MNCLTPCPDCPFHGPKVGNKGDPTSPLIIVGESPGTQELKKKEPFVGPSGLVLDKALDQLHTVEDPYIINSMQCFPGYSSFKNEDTLKAGVNACRNRVVEEINKAPRKVILALGASALWSVTGNNSLKITQERGKLIKSPLAEFGIIPSVHPAFLMRGGSGATFQQFMRDVKYALDLCGGSSPKKPPNVTWEVLQTKEDIDKLVYKFNSLPSKTPVASDIETSGFSFLSDRILSTGFAIDPEYVYVIPEHLIRFVAPLFENDLSFVWHNGKFDVKFLWEAGVNKARVDEDTMLMSYSIDETGGIHDLETVSSDWLNSPNWKKVLDEYLPNRSTSYEAIPKDILHKYMALDIGNTRALYDVLRPIILSDNNLNKLYTRTLIPASNFLARTEKRGIFVDLERISENKLKYAKEIEKYKEEIIEISRQFPDSGYTEKLVGSPKQLSKLIYEDLGIKPYRNQKTTSKDVLEKLPDHPILTSLSKYRKVAKEESTYVRPAEEKIDKDKRVHSTFLLHGTKTGRLASRDPNLQNIPRNPQIRGQYIAAPGRRFIEVDLNQAELRMLACMSNDPVLCYIYETAGMSLHDEVRADIWGYAKDWTEALVQEYLRKFALSEATRFGAKGEDRIIEEQKMRAKAVNFGIVYGRTGPSIAEEFQIAVKEAQSWIDKWFAKFPKAKEYIDKCRHAPERGQVLITPFGNKRRFGVVGVERLDAIQNEASNFPPQSCASHCTLHAGIELEEELKDQYDSYVNNLIHDALLWDTPDDDEIAAKVSKRVIEVMEEIPRKWGFTRVPFIAEAKQGYRWGSLSKVK